MQRHMVLAGLCLAVFLVMVGMGMAVVALPQAYLRASGTLGSSGWLASFFALSYMAFQYPAGRLADRWGYRPVLAAGCLLMALAAVVFSLAQTPAGLYLGRFIQGAGEAPVWASAPAFLGRLHPNGKGRAMGLYNAAFHVGLMLGPLAGARLTPDGGSLPFLAFACLSLAAMVLVLFTVRDSLVRNTGEEACREKPDARLLRGLWPLACGLPLFGAAYGLLVSCLPVRMAVEAGFSQARLGLFFFAGYAGIALGQALVGPLSDRFGRSRFMALGLAAAAGGLVWAVRGTTLLVLPGVGLMGLGLGSFAVASLAFVNDACPAGRAGATSGLYYLAWGAGYFAGPLLANTVGLGIGGGSLACACLAAAGLIALHRAVRFRPGKA